MSRVPRLAVALAVLLVLGTALAAGTDLFETAGRALLAGSHEEAGEDLGRFVEARPDDPRVARARYRLGFLHHLKLDDPAGAIPHYRAVADLEDHPLSDDALWKIAECQGLLDRPAEARETLDALLASHPDGVRASQARRVLSAFREEGADPGPLPAGLRGLLAEGPSAPDGSAVADVPEDRGDAAAPADDGRDPDGPPPPEEVGDGPSPERPDQTAERPGREGPSEPAASPDDRVEEAVSTEQPAEDVPHEDRPDEAGPADSEDGSSEDVEPTDAPDEAADERTSAEAPGADPEESGAPGERPTPASDAGAGTARSQPEDPGSPEDRDPGAPVEPPSERPAEGPVEEETGAPDEVLLPGDPGYAEQMAAEGLSVAGGGPLERTRTLLDLVRRRVREMVVAGRRGDGATVRDLVASYRLLIRTAVPELVARAREDGRDVSAIEGLVEEYLSEAVEVVDAEIARAEGEVRSALEQVRDLSSDVVRDGIGAPAPAPGPGTAPETLPPRPPTPPRTGL